MVRAVLLDIDGVLTVSWQPLPGAVEALRRIRAAGYRVALLTNTTSRTRAAIAATLSAHGFGVDADDVLTAPVLTAAYLGEHHPGARCLLLNSGDIAQDLGGVRLVGASGDAPEGRRDVDTEADVQAAGVREAGVDVVVVGGAGPEFDYARLNRAFAHLVAGAALVAMHRNLFWATREGLQLDAGAFIVGLERAAGVEAVVVGKPSPTFFVTALHRLGVEAGSAVMVGDDVESDVLAAQDCGIGGVLVRTGKYDPHLHAGLAARADHAVDSIIDVPHVLDRLARR